jgi:hypothetical protein
MKNYLIYLALLLLRALDIVGEILKAIGEAISSPSPLSKQFDEHPWQ